MVTGGYVYVILSMAYVSMLLPQLRYQLHNRLVEHVCLQTNEDERSELIRCILHISYGELTSWFNLFINCYGKNYLSVSFDAKSLYGIDVHSWMNHNLALSCFIRFIIMINTGDQIDFTSYITHWAYQHLNIEYIPFDIHHRHWFISIIYKSIA